MFKEQRLIYGKRQRIIKYNYIKEKFTKFERDQKKLFKALGEILGKKQAVNTSRINK